MKYQQQITGVNIMCTKIYLGVAITLSNTTTDSQIYVFGKLKTVIRRCYALNGKVMKITSMAAAKRYVKENFKRI